MKTLETPRLLIRPFTMADLDAVHALLDVELQWAGPGVSPEQRQQKLAFQIALAQWQDTGREGRPAGPEWRAQHFEPCVRRLSDLRSLFPGC